MPELSTNIKIISNINTVKVKKSFNKKVLLLNYLIINNLQTNSKTSFCKLLLYKIVLINYLTTKSKSLHRILKKYFAEPSAIL
jgi:hypothetical protein